MSEHDEDEVVERIAAETYRAQFVVMEWSELAEVEREEYRKQARLNVRALKPGDRLPGGLVCVPAEPTQAMIDAADETEHSIESVTEELAPPRDVQIANFWRAMLAASTD